MLTLAELKTKSIVSLGKVRRLKWELFQLTQDIKDFDAHNRARIKELEAYTKYKRGVK